MFFGSLARQNASATAGPTQSTPLVQNQKFPSFYYLSLLGITVGTTKLNIPSSTFALKSDGGRGTIIDSGTTLAYLQPKAYNVVRKAFISQTKLYVADGSTTGFDLCFSTPSNTSSFGVPKLILHFDGVDLELAESNYFIHDLDSALLCSTIMPTLYVILGNILQQKFFVIYDIGKNKLSFTATQCDKL